MEEQRFMEGARVVKYGDIGDTFHVILEGEAKVLAPDGRVVNRLRLGGVFRGVAPLLRGDLAPRRWAPHGDGRGRDPDADAGALAPGVPRADRARARRIGCDAEARGFAAPAARSPARPPSRIGGTPSTSCERSSPVARYRYVSRRSSGRLCHTSMHASA